ASQQKPPRRALHWKAEQELAFSDAAFFRLSWTVSRLRTVRQSTSLTGVSGDCKIRHQARAGDQWADSEKARSVASGTQSRARGHEVFLRSRRCHFDAAKSLAKAGETAPSSCSSSKKSPSGTSVWT